MQTNINQSQGFPALTCSPGVPVMGLDPSGNYKFLNLTSEGYPASNLPLTTSYFPANPIQVTVNTAVIPTVMAAGIFLFAAPIAILLTAGTYTIDPFVNYSCTTGAGGSINIYLMRVTAPSAFNTYISTLIVGTSSAALTQTNTATGVSGFWPANTLLAMGGTDGPRTLYNAAGGAKNIYLTAGAYSMVAIINTASTVGASQSANIGFNNFSKVL